MAITDRQLGVVGGVSLKAPVVVATTGANITLSSTQVVDGIAVGSCERVLVKDQTDDTENGIYKARGTAWVRDKDFDGENDVAPGTLVYVDRGTANGRTFWAFNTSSTQATIPVGTTQSISAQQVTQALGVLPLTTTGDTLYYDGTAAVRLAIGSSGTVLLSTGTIPSWAQVTEDFIGSSAVVTAAIASSAVTGPKIAMGSDAQGDILYRGSTAYTRLAAGSTLEVLETGGSGAAPVWSFMPRGDHISGMTLANGTDADHDIDFVAGSVVDSSGIVIIRSTAAITKQIDATWAVGSSAGGMESGTTLANNQWYHTHAIRRSDTGVVDYIYSLSPTTPTLPSTSYDASNRVMSVLTDSTANIIPFFQHLDSVWWKDPVVDVSLSGVLGTTARLDALSVPTGIRVLAEIGVAHSDSALTASLVTSPEINNTAAVVYGPVTIQATGNYDANTLFILTDTSAQVRSVADTDTIDTFKITTFGWLDPRGRKA